MNINKHYLKSYLNAQELRMMVDRPRRALRYLLVGCLAAETLCTGPAQGARVRGRSGWTRHTTI